MDISNIKGRFQLLFQTGFFHIFGAETFNKILATVLGLVLVRVLSKPEYGVYAFANSIIAVAIAFNGLGMTSAILQICSELSEKKDAAKRVFAYGYRWGLIVDIVIALCVILLAAIFPLAIQGSNALLAIYSFYPLCILLCGIKQMQLRVNFENRAYAYSTNLQTVLLVLFSIAGAFFFDAAGLVVGQELAYIFTYVFLCYKHPAKIRGFKDEIECSEKKDIWKIALISAFNNGLSFALTLLGTQMIGIIAADGEVVASYQVATLIPFGLLFVPGAIATYIYPYFAKNKDNKIWTIATYKKVLFGCLLLSTGITFLIEILAQPLCLLIFGESYLDSVIPLQILMIGFWFACSFRQIAGNLLVTQRKLVFNAVIGIVSIIVCVVTGVILIPVYGAIGAALSYDAAMILGAIANVAYYVIIIKS